MTDCRKTAERLAGYADGALSPVESAEVEQHLAVCPPCSAKATQEREVRAVLRARAEQLRCHELPAGLRERCEALVEEHRRRKGVK